MKVYRLEYHEFGVFCTQVKNLNYPEDALYAMFGYSCGAQYRSNDDYRSACKSLDELIEYFGSDFAKLIGEGADIIEYNVHKAHVRFGLDPSLQIEVAFNIEKSISRTIILEGEKQCTKQ